MKTWIITNEKGQEIKVRAESINDLPEAFNSNGGDLSEVVKVIMLDEEEDK